ncbi:hypothetical protein EJ05DRAFT_275196 [Pseudovirgaria hyperparasitica]|uniref:Glycosyltransferase family 31 protein n=1 Tax=Pseudovirgaria hyperparasitica TaxID=470096 RepID=A0A6A6WF40_9PEZI|nr:uncharacterized protein EJ05DRAFT_275196 [Pseudovirgaria hyperparasitica]KAF2760197.1 hypothetical protein EJ05DRAFT_275196 [Pseudovirgaria hyperparasitica]
MGILSYQPTFKGRRRPLLFAFLGVFCLFTVWLSQTDYTTSLSRSSYSPEKPSIDTASTTKPNSSITQHDASNVDDSNDCRNAPGASDVHIVLKVGINEIYEKLPPQLLTLLSCAPSYTVYSDVAQTIHGTPIYDSIASINSSFKNTQPEFAYYHTVNALHADGQDIAAVVDKTEEGDKRAGWKLDKWKFLSSYKESYAKAPKAKWYFFMEPDTAVIWPNLLTWTRRLNPDREIYSGSQNSHGGVTFAHGGSGVLVSKAAMQRLMDEYDKMQDEWWLNVAAGCCGDVEMARNFLDVGISMTASFPLIQGERLGTIDWNERHMCTPSVSWHHVNTREILDLWELMMAWVKEHGWEKPLMFRDIFSMYVEKHVRERRDDWDNISDDWKYVKPKDEMEETWAELDELEKKAVESFEDCRSACSAIPTCRQFKWKVGECYLGENIRVGTVKTDSNISSGWLLERVKEFGKVYEDCEPNWEFNQ